MSLYIYINQTVKSNGWLIEKTDYNWQLILNRDIETGVIIDIKFNTPVRTVEVDTVLLKST